MAVDRRSPERGSDGVSGSRLPLSIQRDIKAFAGYYSAASEEAIKLLFSVGDAGAIDAACLRVEGETDAAGQGDRETGRRGDEDNHARHWALVENALVVEKSSIQELPPILRAYEGCARALLGEIEEANLVKLHRYSGKVTYLVCDQREGSGTCELHLQEGRTLWEAGRVEEMGYGHCRRRFKVN